VHGLAALVEVADETELSRALDARAEIIGVNARDLDTLAVDVSRAGRVLARIPSDRTALHLSGVKSPADIAGIRHSRADGALVGEALMRVDDPAPMLAALRQSAVR